MQTKADALFRSHQDEGSISDLFVKLYSRVVAHEIYQERVPIRSESTGNPTGYLSRSISCVTSPK